MDLNIVMGLGVKAHPRIPYSKMDYPPLSSLSFFFLKNINWFFLTPYNSKPSSKSLLLLLLLLCLLLGVD